MKRIHINRQNLQHNTKTGERLPVYTVKAGGKTHLAHALNVEGPSFFNNPSSTKPLACGARVWLWTRARVELLIEVTDYSGGTERQPAHG